MQSRLDKDHKGKEQGCEQAVCASPDEDLTHGPVMTVMNMTFHTCGGEAMMAGPAAEISQASFRQLQSTRVCPASAVAPGGTVLDCQEQA